MAELMPDIKTVTGGSGFVPMVAGGVAAPLIAGAIPGLGNFGSLAPLTAGALMAYFGKGALRQAGQGAVISSSVALLSPVLSGAGKSASRSAMEAF